jgi:hypothetical protein
MVRGSVIALVLTGCTQLFGLESPTAHDASDSDVAPSADGDGDGVADGNDNCPSLANPDQTDVDGNSIGDRCEGCVTLPLDSDDDGDMVIDAADNCIGGASAQMDSDADGIGNACDERAGKDTRFCVWTFRNPAMGEDPNFWSTSWTNSSPWTISDSKLRFSSWPVLTEATPKGYVFDAPMGIAVDTDVTLVGYTAPMTYALQLELEHGSTFRCQLHQPSAGGGVLQLERDGTVDQAVAIGIATPTPLRAYVRFAFVVDNGKLSVHCSLNSSLAPTFNLARDYVAPSAIKVRPALVANNSMLEFAHVTLYKLGI